MSLLQIAEPGQSLKPHEAKLVIGIDLGTTNSLVAAKKHGVVSVLADENGRKILPSVLAINGKGEQKIGDDALNAGAEFAKISSAKRLIGYQYDEIKAQNISVENDVVATNSIPAINTEYAQLNPIEVSSVILSTLRKRAEQTFQKEVEGAVITVPAYFDEARRKATKDAAKLAGLNVLRLINEPTAAALAYGLDHQANGHVLVYDLGGGTFDVSVLTLSDGVFEVKATAGDILLGGDDVDDLICDWLINTHQVTNVNRRTLKELAKKAKETLATEDRFVFELDAKKITLTNDEFTKIISPIVDKTIACVKNVLADSKLATTEIEHIVMVGGSTRLHLVQEKVKALFNLDALTEINPDEVVAIGAAIAAENLAGNNSQNDALLLDVTPLSLGIETAGELVEVIIPRNTPIPVVRAQDFTTFKDGQTRMSIHVLQGERDNVHECRSLAKFSLTDIPPMAAGAARIRITFAMDADGLLTVSAKEETTQHESKIEVSPSYGLSEDELLGMLQDSLENAETDIDYRRFKEQLVESERVLDAIEVALGEDGELLTAAEQQPILAAIEALKTANAGHCPQAIKKAISELESVSADFIEKRMNHAISKVMKGHSVKSFES